MSLAPPVPVTWRGGQFPQPADFNTQVRDAFSFLTARTVFRAWQNAAAPQSIPNNTITVLTLDTVLEDTYSGWTSGAGNKYTAQQPGLYWINACYYASGARAAGNVASAFVNINGSGTYYQGQQGPTSTLAAGWGFDVGIGLYLRTGDYVQPNGWQLTGAALGTVSNNIGQACSMEVIWFGNL